MTFKWMIYQELMKITAKYLKQSLNLQDSMFCLNYFERDEIRTNIYKY